MNDQNLLEDQPIAWTPTPDVIERARLTEFMQQVGVATWDELYAYSINDVEKFTEEVIKFLDIKFDPPYEKLLDTTDGIEFPNWFGLRADTPVRMSAKHEQTLAADENERNIDNLIRVSAKHEIDLAGGTGDADKSVRSLSAGLNITEMCLDRWQTDEMKDRPAIVWEEETDSGFPIGQNQTLTYGNLIDRVKDVAAGLRSFGLGKGDAIGIHAPMVWETIVILLAINRVGAIAVPVFSGYGIDAIASRLSAVNAVALFTSDGFERRGKFYNAFEVAESAVKKCSSVKHIFLYGPRRAVFETKNPKVVIDLVPKVDDIPTYSKNLSELEPTSAEDPLMILYTSGTTGKPKGIAHTHASFPIKAAQDMAFGTDVGKSTRISWYTDIGWMMGPWLIYGALINGATICIYDGAPDYPTTDRMWEFCAKHKVEVLGISPTLIRALSNSEDERVSSPHVSKGNATDADLPQSREDAKEFAKDDARKKPFERHDLSHLRIFASTGEPWNPAPWWWLFEEVGNSKLPIINYSGGTEIAGGILMGNPLLPIKPCSFPAPCLGMDVDIFDEDGNPVEAGKVGELVIKQPWIGMARGFWQEKERYLDTYWRRFKDIWVHGDFAMRDKDGHWFILGRSDDTLKVAGKRVGPAEVESLLVAHPLVIEAAVIGVPDEVKGTAMVAFCVLTGEQASPLSPENDDWQARMLALQSELKALVAKDMGKPLTPSRIHFVSALPKTRNAKVMRRVIRSAYLSEDPGDLSALENPGSVKEIRQIINLDHVL